MSTPKGMCKFMSAPKERCEFMSAPKERGVGAEHLHKKGVWGHFVPPPS